MSDNDENDKTESYQKPSKSRRRLKVFVRIAAIASAFVIAGCMCVAFVILVYLNRGLPSLDSLKNYAPKEVSTVLSEQDEVIGEFFEEKRFVNRDIPLRIKHAFIAAEDAGFYYHKGIDFLGMLRAAYVNVASGRIRQGASTLTQQVARSFLLSPERTFERKIREIILSWQIENSLTKDEILDLYLNHIFLGAGAYGVAAAAEVYFGKRLEDVSVAEAAILGGLPQAPSRYSPQRNPMRVKRRQLYVLKQMLENNFITKQEYEEAANADVFVEPPKNINKTIAPYFVEYVRQKMMDKYGSQRVLEDGLKIYTTLDLEQNRAAENALRKGLSELEKRQGYRGPLRQTSRDEYFKDKELRDDDDAAKESALEVAVSEIKGRGKILMRQSRTVEVGEVLEGVVTRIQDDKGEALVEYNPGYFALLKFDDMKWAHKRVVADEDEDVVIPEVRKVSDVLSVGDVVLFSATTAQGTDASKPIGGLLEQHTEVEGAIMAMDPYSGFVKAMVGGYDFNRSQFNRALQAKRQPGSAFKPIVYAASFDLGFTPASLIQDTPITFENAADQEKWRPANYDQKFLGDVTIRNSLLASRNIPTIRLLNEVGIDSVIEYARRLGISSALERDFTLALGSSVTTLQELLQPYVVFATGGYRQEPIFIKRVVDRNGNILEESVKENFEASTSEAIREGVAEVKKQISSVVFAKDETSGKNESASFLQDSTASKAREERKVITPPLKPGQVLSTEASFIMTHLLKENILYGTGRRARDLQRPASGKTGTTDQNKDAWFMGYTPNLVAGVWVGYDDLRVLGRAETGSRAAVPIWLDFMAKALEPYPAVDFRVPETIEFARINSKTGLLASPQDKTAIFEAFIKGTAPTETTPTTLKESDFYLKDQ